MPPEHISIRHARESDIPGILEIYNDAILNTTALYTYEPFTLEMMQQWFAEKTAKDLPVFVAEGLTAAPAPAAGKASSGAPAPAASKATSASPAPAASAASTVAGFASYGPFRPWPAYKYSVEHSIYVHKDQRGKGIAKKLLRTLIDHASAAGLHTIVAGIDSRNDVSINLHRQFGFKETGQIAQVGYKFGRWLDLVFMQLILENNLQPHEK
ncbi:MAG TPA: GNAT family N-acetyltransferase [Puia sp.]|nr:GNAT family N-acetyltransferase [Puia sp.]